MDTPTLATQTYYSTTTLTNKTKSMLTMISMPYSDISVETTTINEYHREGIITSIIVQQHRQVLLRSYLTLLLQYLCIGLCGLIVPYSAQPHIVLVVYLLHNDYSFIQTPIKMAKKGVRLTEAHKQNISKALRGKPRVPSALRGRTLTEAHKQKLRGRTLTEAHKQKISEKCKGKPKSEEHKRKIREALHQRYGFKKCHTLEQEAERQKFREAQQNRQIEKYGLITYSEEKTSWGGYYKILWVWDTAHITLQQVENRLRDKYQISQLRWSGVLDLDNNIDTSKLSNK